MKLQQNKNRIMRNQRHQNFYIFLFLTLLIGVLLTGFLQFWPYSFNIGQSTSDLKMGKEQKIYTTINSSSPQAHQTDHSCLYHKCFEVYNCGYNSDNRISVYVYPPTQFTDESGISVSLTPSKEFLAIINSIKNSVYYTANPEKACLYLPQIDLLNQNNLRLKETSQSLASLSRWNNGTNHLLFNMLPGTIPDYNTSLDVKRARSLLAGGGFSIWSYRSGFDVSIPVFNPLTANITLPSKSSGSGHRWTLVSAQVGLHSDYLLELNQIAYKNNQFLLLDACSPLSNKSFNYYQRCDSQLNIYRYPHILQEASFCIVLRGARLGQTALYDSLLSGCIPVIIADSYVLPFSEVLDWQRAAVVVKEEDLSNIMNILELYTAQTIKDMQQYGSFFFKSYFASIELITLTTLQIINDRVFPFFAINYEYWNQLPTKLQLSNPLKLPLIASKSAGFTAVILTFDRLDYLFQVIKHVALCPSLSKILVIWNNQNKQPPVASFWPRINKPLKVVQTRYNRLSNRFYPYDEIETEAILALDDDIVDLTINELEFGFSVWREFPDRLVGYPSRIHLWDNETLSWKYESEWRSEISMVLTGASYYHKVYSYLYTNSMPKGLKQWSDEQMNCEDIAMNFLIANATGKAPIKVAPRQKFKCPQCPNPAMLSSDLLHMVERSECINHFTNMYGHMPLKSVEFRADPLLYKDPLPNNLKRFVDIGSL